MTIGFRKNRWVKSCIVTRLCRVKRDLGVFCRGASGPFGAVDMEAELYELSERFLRISGFDSASWGSSGNSGSVSDSPARLISAHEASYSG